MGRRPSPLWSIRLTDLFCCAPRAGESLARSGSCATIVAPCLSCPISPSWPRRSTRRWPVAPSSTRRRPDPSPSAEPRPSWMARRPATARRAPAREVPDLRSRTRSHRRQPDAHGPVPARGAGRQRPPNTAFVLRSDRATEAPRDAAEWTRGAPWLPRTTSIGRVRYRDPSRWARSTCCPQASRAVPGLGPRRFRARGGRSGADPRRLAERIRRHPGELKNLLRNQSFVAGIGNAYSDEILHAARLCRFASAPRSPPKRSTRCTRRRAQALADAGSCCASASRRRSRSRFATSSPSTARAAALPALRHAPERGQLPKRATTWCRGCQR